ncbi:hypothetical protein BJF86_00540 [Serinicoccus sp. CNJ-927]|uniref:hypothetical protein n=1 Tax=Serinicoccus sp. CNJ-927 TaxID=1904970 RepID=UPI000964E8F7|nr:hypothetical protein [Serinicoccus sp. CNJ-927]OLT43330.1 hypothetical protein BJF86_00540 [Serinicoccus sp. CNJ-927]
MVDLTEYEQRGGLETPFELTKKHQRAQEESGRIREHAHRLAQQAPPLRPGQVSELSRLLGHRTPPHELMRWRLRLYCGHVVETTSHYTHKTLHSAFTGSTCCPECELDPATIVDGEAIGLAEEPPAPAGGDTDQVPLADV